MGNGNNGVITAINGWGKGYKARCSPFHKKKAWQNWDKEMSKGRGHVGSKAQGKKGVGLGRHRLEEEWGGVKGVGVLGQGWPTRQA